MGRSMLPILMLTTVALSSSDVLPSLSDKDNIEPFKVDDQNNDNIFMNYYQSRNIPNYNFYYNRAARESYESAPNLKEITKTIKNGYEIETDGKDASEIYNKDENYDDEGYRKEQWHNYPRQLDRLHNLEQIRDETNEVSQPKYVEPNDKHFDDFIAKEFRVQSADGDRNIYENVVAATNPFLVLKVQLTYLRDDMNRNELNQYPILLPLQSEDDQDRNAMDNNSFMKNIESTANLVKVKRQEPTNNGDNEIAEEDSFPSEIENSPGRKQAVKKRLFSLWSRLQSLSHRGHELHHRRHLHAYYGLPDTKGNGIVTAQTRASFVRPPGSPLRWG